MRAIVFLGFALAACGGGAGGGSQAPATSSAAATSTATTTATSTSVATATQTATATTTDTAAATATATSTAVSTGTTAQQMQDINTILSVIEPLVPGTTQDKLTTDQRNVISGVYETPSKISYYSVSNRDPCATAVEGFVSETERFFSVGDSAVFHGEVYSITSSGQIVGVHANWTDTAGASHKFDSPTCP